MIVSEENFKSRLSSSALQMWQIEPSRSILYGADESDRLRQYIMKDFSPDQILAQPHARSH